MIRTTDDARALAKSLLSDLLDAQSYAFAHYLDFRVRTLDGEHFDLHTGSAQYDIDHRGAWGAGCVRFDWGVSEVEDALTDAIEEAADAHAQCGDDGDDD